MRAAALITLAGCGWPALEPDDRAWPIDDRMGTEVFRTDHGLRVAATYQRDALQIAFEVIADGWQLREVDPENWPAITSLDRLLVMTERWTELVPVLVRLATMKASRLVAHGFAEHAGKDETTEGEDLLAEIGDPERVEGYEERARTVGERLWSMVRGAA